MLDSIYIGMTGLMGYSRGLQVIANNTANLNTPGFKSSSLQFSDMFYSDNTGHGGTGSGQTGYGLNTNGTTLSFNQGDLRQTGNNLDLAINGQGLFVLKDTDGNIRYTRDGQFQFNKDGVLVNTTDNSVVMGFDANGQLGEVSIAGLSTNAAKATANLTFSGNILPSSPSQTVGSVTVYDAVGGVHQLSVVMTNTSSTKAGSWQVQLMDGGTQVGSGQLVFSNGRLDPASAKLSMNYTPAGLGAMPLTLDFTSITSFAANNLASLTMSTQDGYASGGLTKESFDNTGVLVLTYANGQTVKGSRLALARFDSAEAVGSEGRNEFKATDSSAWHMGEAGDSAFGSISSGMVEISNVDLSQQFSDLVVTQRGYQASSQIISTANEMLQQLFSMSTGK